jgi:predicted SAM-dependent methyltransferase
VKEYIKHFIKKYTSQDLVILAQEIRRTRSAIKSRRLQHSRQTKSLKYIRNLLDHKEEISLEIGAGAKKGQNGWVTLDINPNSDIYWDLTMGLPFPTGSIQRIYASHVLEHFTLREIQKLLNECLRVLIPGGHFSVCVPNANFYISAYSENKNLDPGIFFLDKPAYNFNSKIDYVNYTAYMYGHHKYMFDEMNLLALLKAAGFKNGRLRNFDSTIDLQERDFESIYVIGDK